MTLSGRNIFFRFGVVFCAASALLVPAVSFFVVPAYPSMEENLPRPLNLLGIVFGYLFEAEILAVHASLIMLAAFSFVAILLILFYFEQTSVPEIFYIAVFIISLSFEALRLVLPLHLVYDIPSFYLLTSSHILLFARHFGIFSMFAASLCAAGYEIQMTRNVIIVVFIAALAVTLGVPIDTQSWDPSLNMIHGFNSMFIVIDTAAFFLTILNFLIAAKIHDTKEYMFIGLGLAFALSGRFFLLYADNWAGAVSGILMLSFGTWFVCSKLHKIYLWL